MGEPTAYQQSITVCLSRDQCRVTTDMTEIIAIRYKFAVLVAQYQLVNNVDAIANIVNDL